MEKQRIYEKIDNNGEEKERYRKMLQMIIIDLKIKNAFERELYPEPPECRTCELRDDCDIEFENCELYAEIMLNE